MKVTYDRTENRTAYIIVEPEAVELEKHIDKIYKRSAKRLQIPEYPNGDAPREVLENYIAREQVLEDAITELAYEDSPKIIKDQNIENWLQPMITVLQFEPPKYEIAVALRPIIEIADHRSLKVEPEPLEVTDEEVDIVLEKNRIQIGTLVTVDRPVKSEDLIIVDIEGKISGKPFLVKKASKFFVNGNFAPEMPGFSDKMIGAKKNEEFSFKLTLPKDYEDKSVAGKEADFHIKIYDVRELRLDELNDDFAKKVAPGVSSLEELKKRIRYHMMKEKEMSADTRFKEKIVATLIEKSHLEYPTMMIDLQAKQITEDYLQQMKTAAKDDKEYQEKLKQISMEKLKKSSAELAKKRVLWTLVLDQVAKAEGISVSEEEITAEIDGMTEKIEEEMKQKEQRRHLHSYERENVIDIIKVRKTVNRLAEIVTGKPQPDQAK